MKTLALSTLLFGLLGCRSTPQPKPLRPQAEAPAAAEPRLPEENSTCNINQTVCVRPAPPQPDSRR